MNPGNNWKTQKELHEDMIYAAECMLKSAIFNHSREIIKAWTQHLLWLKAHEEATLEEAEKNLIELKLI